MGKPTKKGATVLGSFGERVARERAARRRAAKERVAREQTEERAASVDEISGGPEIAAEPEVVEIPRSDLMNEVSVLAALISSGLARSHPEARRLFRDDGVRVNDAPVLSDKAKLRLSDVSADGTIKLGLGGDRYVILRPV